MADILSLLGLPTSFAPWFAPQDQSQQPNAAGKVPSPDFTVPPPGLRPSPMDQFVPNLGAAKSIAAGAVEPFGQLGGVMTGQSQTPVQDLFMAAMGLAPIGPPGARGLLKPGLEAASAIGSRIPQLAEKIAQFSPEWHGVPVIDHLGNVIHNPINSQHVNGPMLMMDAQGNLSPGILAYHGSPHDFDRFDLSKIGTGEGAQAYGHGLYFAENEGVAKGYRGQLSSPDVYFEGKNLGPVSKLLEVPKAVGQIGSGVSTPGVRGSAGNEALARFSPTEREAITAAGSSQSFDEAMATLREQASQAWRSPEARKSWQEKADALQGLRGKLDFRPGGRTYQVAIKASPEHFLDWDRPLSEQSPEAKTAVQRLAGELGAKDYRTSGQGLIESLGSALMRKEGISSADARAAVSTKLREAGIPGIKYLDQGSRVDTSAIDQLEKDLARWRQGNPSPEELKPHEDRLAQLKRQVDSPTRNYVVFDDKLIDILKKYGLIGMLGGAGAAPYFPQQGQH